MSRYGESTVSNMQSRYQKATANPEQIRQSLPRPLQARQRHQKAKRRGVVIILAFLLIPMLFILLYLSSDQLHDDDAFAAHTNRDTATDENTELASSLQTTETLGASNTAGSDEAGSSGQALTGESEIPPVEIIGTVYLTFDDGPDREITPEILDILLEEDVKATFFVLPNEGVEDIFRRIIDEEHEIGNHSFSHRYDLLYESNAGTFREDILKAQRFIYDNFGYITTSFRFPGGSMSWPKVLRSRLDVINELGYRHYDWLVDPEDWRIGRTSEDIVRETLEQTKNLGREHVIVLLHDYRNKHLTIEALPGIIKGLREMGYEFDIVRNYPAGLRTGFGSSS